MSTRQHPIQVQVSYTTLEEETVIVRTMLLLLVSDGAHIDTKKMIWGQNNYIASTGSQFPSNRYGLTTVLGIYSVNILLHDNNLNVAPDSQHIIMYGCYHDSEDKKSIKNKDIS